jgi:hypothetical protein
LVFNIKQIETVDFYPGMSVGVMPMDGSSLPFFAITSNVSSCFAFYRIYQNDKSQLVSHRLPVNERF